MPRTTIILAAPHRPHFLIGLLQFIAAMVWWAWFQHRLATGGALPSHAFADNTVHGPAMIFLALAPLFCGFLLTVFPRWASLPDLGRREYRPPATAFALSLMAFWSGMASGRSTMLAVAFAMATLALVFAGLAMARVHAAEMRSDRPPTWHARSILLAWLFGIGAAASSAWAFSTPDYAVLIVANRVAIYLFILPVFVTVAHRMIPFFAGNVVEGYLRWRPMWLLAAFWAASLLLVAGELLALVSLKLAGAACAACLCVTMAWRWWPRAKAPGLLWVLIGSFAWAPIGYALQALEAAGVTLGRAPDHALLVGFAGGLVVAMVTRVTQGHSGRPLVMPMVAWVAFAGIESAAVIRILGALRNDQPGWMMAASIILSLALSLWAGRNALIYLSPRKDGKPG